MNIFHSLVSRILCGLARFALLFTAATASAELARLSFPASSQAFDESWGTLRVWVDRAFGFGQPVTATFTTQAGTAVPGKNYVETSGILNFGPYQSSAQIQIPILDDSVNESAGTFKIVLTAGDGSYLGQFPVLTVRIQDNDGPGKFEFATESSTVGEPSN